jgi:eukaryotic-like serine/threonine-protein kinase
MNRARSETPSRPSPVVRPGTMIADKYRVEKELGRGAFGVVVRAVHLALDERVAIKVLTDGGGGAEGWAEDAARFRREAQATAALRGEHVVRILDVDVLENGFPYMVMELLDGETLHHVLHTRGPLTFAEAVDHCLAVLAALAEAHAAGIVHRDLKPANVFLTKGKHGTPIIKVLDFGVSKSGVHGGENTITKTGAMLGTAAYMPPEQMLDAKRVDARADLWSVAIILYELCTKTLPFGEGTSAVTAMALNRPTRLSALRPDVPPALEAIVMRCLERDPARRFATAADLAAALAPFGTARSRAAFEFIRRAGLPAGAAAPLPTDRRPRGKSGPSGRLVLPVVGLLLGLALGVIGGVIVLASRRHAAPAAPSASARPLAPR